MVMYFEYQTNELLERGIDPETDKAQIDPQVLGTIMYSFLDYIQVSESERLVTRNIKLKENPLSGLMDRAAGQKSHKRQPVDSSDEEEKVD